MQQAQQSCGDAIGGANGGDAAQAGLLGSTIGSFASIAPGSSALSGDALNQLGRLTGATSTCNQSKQQGDQTCTQQQQAAQNDPNAKQQGEPQQTDKNKQQGDSNMSSMIGPLLMGLAAAMAAYMASQNTNQQAQSANTATNPSFPDQTQPPTPTAPTMDQGQAAFNTPAMQQAANAIQAAGGVVTTSGVTMPDGTQQSWSSLAGGGSGGSGAVAAGGANPRLDGTTGGSGNPNSLPKIGAQAEGAGGAEGGNGSNSDFHYEPYKSRFAGAQKVNQEVAGKVMNLEGTPIGVKGDDIFEMIHRAYDRRRQVNQFDETVNFPGAAIAGRSNAFSGRSPASTNDLNRISLRQGHK